MKNILVSVYEGIMTMFGDVKVFKYPFFLLYHPQGYLMRGENVREALESVEAGDILVRGYLNYLDSYFIPGFFSHAGVYVGDNKVVHALAEGVIEEDILNFCRCDYMAVLRPVGVTKENKREACRRALECVGKDYDFFFDFENENQLCCTELAHYVWKFKKKLIDIKPVVKKVCLGLIKKSMLLADDYVESKSFKVVYMSDYADKNFRRIGNV